MERDVHQDSISSSTAKPIGDIARDLRVYASAVPNGPVAAKLLAAAAELDARDAARHSSNDGE
ncbi:MAG: hypothetical protein WDN01_13985 [Rhizomicrobium sp.]